MPVEIIGEAGTPGASREWIDAECQLAIKHLIKVCGEPPPEMELEVQWQEHDLGEFRRSFLRGKTPCVALRGSTSKSARRPWLSTKTVESFRTTPASSR